LPTEAEWEYACRAGTETRYYTGDQGDFGRAAWYSVNSGLCNLSAVKLDLETLEESNCRPHPVGLKDPNGWGLYDMHGNVYEWCNDWYEPYTSGKQSDPAGAHAGSIRLIRGGSWGSYANRCTSVGRSGYKPESRNFFTGFRVVRR
jgi:formylglycine-generating enzyme required for sulfatase activity